MTGTLITVAPGPGPIGPLLRTAIDAEQVGARRLHLSADQPDPEAAVTALREQTRLIITGPGADEIRSAFTDLTIDPDDDLPKLVARAAKAIGKHPDGASLHATGPAALPVLLAVIAAGGHPWIPAPDSGRDHPSARSTEGSPERARTNLVSDGRLAAGERSMSRADTVALVARAAGLSRIAGRPPLDIGAARALLGL